ncbi:biopolymer transporter ExbD [Marinomonas agarivorans]|nr:biopolymer transporter ExbD [Marinomonas agarivorans]
MKFRRQKIEEIQINLTPLIDVVFLLLIFFMVTTTFKQTNELTVDLPTAEAAKISAAQQKQIDILITAEGQYSLNGQTLINQEAETLKQGILEISEGDSSLPIIISADAKAAYELILKVYDAAAQLGFAKLAHTTTQDISE